MGITNYKVYTPEEYAHIIIDLSLEKYFSNEYTKEKLDRIRVADLSCGTGNLLLIMLKKLVELSHEITGKYYFNSCWIHGYDIDEKAIKEYKSKGKIILDNFGIQGEIIGILKDSIIDEINEKYNIIIGNPPYLGEKNHKELFDTVRTTSFGKKYYESKMDYFYFFIEKGVELLEEDGILTYVTTNYWFKADSAIILRNTLKEKGYFTGIIDYNKTIFKNALGQHNTIFSWTKGEKSLVDKKEIEVIKEGEHFLMLNRDLYTKSGNIVLLNKENRKFNERVSVKSNYLLSDIFNINQGVVSGADKIFVTKEYEGDCPKYLKPFYKNKDVMKYSCNKDNEFWIHYIERGEDIDIDLKAELYEHKEKLSMRREVKNKSISWWELTWPRNKEVFCTEKILVRQRCKTNFFAYDDGEFFGSADIYYLTLKDKKFNIFYLLGYLNSTTFYKWYKINGKHKGYNMEFYSTPLKTVPLYYPDNQEEIDYVENLVRKQIENYSEDIQQELDNYFEELFTK